MRDIRLKIYQSVNLTSNPQKMSSLLAALASRGTWPQRYDKNSWDSFAGKTFPLNLESATFVRKKKEAKRGSKSKKLIASGNQGTVKNSTCIQ